MLFTVIVVTHNRAAMLRDTLGALAKLTYAGPWEVLVVDNGSTDDTRAVAERMAHGYPVVLRYLHESTPGKYFALNTGIRAAQGSLIAATDDDAYPAPDWLTRARDGLDRFGCDYVGGRVYPVWRGTPPTWLDARDSIVGKVLGLQDHGPDPLEYGHGRLTWPIGVNIAYRREVFDRVGVFDGHLGRVAGTLRNQSQREWHLRARAAGIRGMYLPDMVVHHSVEAERLTRRYFHRWFYWHGISRAILYQSSGRHLLEPESDDTHKGESHLLGVPASLWRHVARSMASAAKRWLTGRTDAALQYELAVCFCAGVVRQRLRDRRLPPPDARDERGRGEAPAIRQAS
jgi:glucosyl-dolichyl phosphate glucuronosyltransferase